MKELAVWGGKLLMAPTWGMALLRGVLLILVGVTMIVNPGLAVIALAWACGLLLCVAGLGSFVQALNVRSYRELLIFYSVVVFLLGIFIIVLPGVASIAVVLIFAFWLLMSGGSQVYFALTRMPSRDPLRLMSLISGGLSLIVGLMVLLNPLSGLETIGWLLGIFLLCYGAFLCMLSSVLFRVRK